MPQVWTGGRNVGRRATFAMAVATLACLAATDRPAATSDQRDDAGAAPNRCDRQWRTSPVHHGKPPSGGGPSGPPPPPGRCSGPACRLASVR